MPGTATRWRGLLDRVNHIAKATTMTITPVAPSKKNAWLMVIVHSTSDNLGKKENKTSGHFRIVRLGKLTERVQAKAVFIVKNRKESSASFMQPIPAQNGLTAQRRRYDAVFEIHPKQNSIVWMT